MAAALREVEGTYGIAVISADQPDTIVAARKGSPLLVGVGDGEWFIASDASAVLAHTRSVIYLDDGEMVVLTRKGYHVRDLAATRIEKPVNKIEWDLSTVERGGYAHFMLKEIFEQPESVRNTMRGHLLEEEGTARRHRPQPDRRRHQADQPGGHHRLRHLLARRPDRRVPARGVGPHPGRGRVRHRVPLPQPGDRRAARW